MDEKDFLEIIREALILDIDEVGAIKSVQTFQECGVLSTNQGLVVRVKNGEEFQVIIMKS